MAKVVWSEEAQKDLAAIQEYIARQSPSVAESVVDRLLEVVKRLSDFPASGRPVEELKHADVREVVEPPYHIAYVVAGDTAVILKVWHGKQLFPL